MDKRIQLLEEKFNREIEYLKDDFERKLRRLEESLTQELRNSVYLLLVLFLILAIKLVSLSVH